MVCAAGVLAGVRVVVVDDQDPVRDFFHDVLHLAGAEVWAAASAREALTMIEAHRPHVVVSDVMMPREDGYWLIAAVRAMPPPRPRTVAVTGNAREHSRDKLLGAGYDAHLAKPVGVDTITAMVARLAGRAQ